MSMTKTRGTRDNPYLLDDIFLPVRQTLAWRIAAMAVRWRTELIVLGALLAALAELAGQVSLLWAIVVLAAAHGIVFGIPHSRRFAVRRFWCVLTRHRFHRLCFEARLHTRAGRVPLVLWVHPTKVGERLFVWCRAGTAAEHFEDRINELRAACYARDARVTRNTRWSHLLTIDIIRHDTLAASHKVSTPLERLSVVYASYLDPPAPAGADTGSGPPPWPQQPADTPDPG